MLPGMNPKMLKDAMKKMGVKQEQIEAYEVVIRTEHGDFVIKNPEVMKVSMMGQESLQIVGEMKPAVKKEDIKLIQEQTGCSEEEAQEALQETEGDIAEAILKLSPDGA